MITDPLSLFFDDSADKSEWQVLLEIISAANGSQNIGLLANRVLDALERLIPFQCAFVLLFRAGSPDVTLAQQRRMPDAVRLALEEFSLPDEFVRDMDTWNGAAQYHLLEGAVAAVLPVEQYGSPIQVPLLADGRAMGLLVLASDLHPEVRSEWGELAVRYQTLLGIVGTQVGIAIRRADLERKVRTSEEWYRAFIQDSLDGFWETNETGVITYVNEAAVQILGYPRSHILGKRIDEISQEDPQRLATLRQMLRVQGYATAYQLAIRTQDGTRKVISETIRTVRDADGTMRGYQGVVRDITRDDQTRVDLERRTYELLHLHELATGLNNPTNLREALEKAVQIIIDLTGTELIAIFLIDPEMASYEIAAHRNVPPFMLEAFGHAALNPAVFQPGFPLEQANLIEYLILTQRALTGTEIKALPQFKHELLRAAGYESGMMLPIRYDEKVYGAIAIAAHHEFDVQSQQLLDNITAQLGLAIQNRQIYANLDEQRRLMQAVTNTGTLMQHAPTAQAALPAVMREIREALEADYVVLQLLKDDHFETVTASDTRELERNFRIAAYEQRILDTEMPQLVIDRDDETVDAEQRQILRKLEMRAVCGVRLYAHDRPLGILFVNSSTPRQWRELHLDVIRRFAQQIAYALENKQLLDEIQRQVKQVQALAHAARLIGAAEPDTALSLIAEEIARVFPADYVSFHLREGEYLRRVAESHESYSPVLLPILQHQHLILRELDTTYVTNGEKNAVHPAQQEFLRQYNLVADLGLPLVAENKALGIMYISQKKEHFWSDGEVRLAQTFAQQISAALSNATMMRQSKAQVLELRALARSASLLGLSRSPASTLPQIAAELRKTLKADYVGFHLLKDNKLHVITEPHVAWADDVYEVKDYHAPILQHLQKMIVTDRERDAKTPEHRAILADLGIVADLGVPMTTHGRAVGILFVSHFTPRIWQEDEIRLIETYAQHIATVLDNVQLLEQREVSLLELQQLVDLYEISTTILDEDMLTEMALAVMAHLLNADRAFIIPVEGDRLGRARTSDGVVHEVQPPPMTPTIRHVLDTGIPIIMDPDHPPASPDPRNHFGGIHSAMTVRMATASEKVGLLGFGFFDGHLFTEAEIRLAQAAANQLGMAFGNARLNRDQKERIAKLNFLTTFSQYCGSIRDSRLLEQGAIERIPQMLRVKAASIRLVEDGVLTAGAGVGYAFPELRNHAIPISSGLQHVLVQQKPFEIEDLANYPGLPSHWRERHLQEGFQSLLMVPMIADQKCTGILALYQSEVTRWQEADVQFAQTIANTLALALSNTRQIETSQHQSDELQATLDSVFSGVFTTDEHGVILSWNRAAQEITGYGADEMHNKRWDQDGPKVGEPRRPDTLLQEAMVDKSARFSLAPRYFTRADGQVIQLREAAAPLKDADGNVRGAVCAFWERTEEQAAERAKIDFINEVGHQLGNKLSAVIMSTHHLSRTDLNERLREEYTRVVRDTLEDLEAFNKRFLEFQRELVREEIIEGEVSVQDLLKQRVSHYRANKIERSFRVSGQFDLVRADVHRLGVVLDNLLENAVKYSFPRSTISIQAALPDTAQFKLAITSRGKPVPADVLPHLFERWQRGDLETPGSGLGLWLAITKLHEMGGEIEVTTSQRRGTTFTITLRRVDDSLPLPKEKGSEPPGEIP